MPSFLRLALSALAASVPFCDALTTTSARRTTTSADVTWTVTSYVAIRPTVSTYEYTYGGTRTSTYTETWSQTISLKPGITPSATPLSSVTRTRSYGSLEIVSVYLDGNQVATEDIVPTTSYDPSATDYTYDRSYTTYVQEVVWTAPASCAADFTVSTYQRLTEIPTEVLEQRTDLSTKATVSTGYSGDKYTLVTAYVPTSAYPQITITATTEDYYYSYYVRSCINPTATGADRYPTASTTRYNGGSNSGSNSNSYDDWWSYHSVLKTYVIVLAALLPGLFLIGFIENYFWFRRMMVGQFSLRFGTCFWILLLWPIIFATRRCPARDDETQKTLREQWKKVGFGTALGLWFRWGFRHRYPVDLLGAHPQYHNPDPNAPTTTAPMSGAPPGGGFVYYVQGPPGPDGNPTIQPIMVPANQLPEGFKYPQQPQVAMMPPNGAPGAPPGAPPQMTMYYPYPQAPQGPQGPQPPQPAYMAPAPTQQQADGGPALPPRSPPPTVPSPLSTTGPQAPTSPPPPVPPVTPGEERGESSRAAGDGSNPPPGAAK